jgi:hypothetical protein
MLLLNKRKYEKKEPFRSATLFVIVCEGEKREPKYFQYFDGISSRNKVYPVPSEEGKSAPNHLVQNANSASERYGLNVQDELWFVVDTDRWRDHLHKLQSECSAKNNWHVAISNPCFEVWLYYHFSRTNTELQNIDQCSFWKPLIPLVSSGGFDMSIHPGLIKTAIDNSQNRHKETGYFPEIGCTQVFKLAEKIYALIENTLVQEQR